MLSPRFLFLSIVALELAHSGTAILLHRVPSGHDGFQYFVLQYFFLNNAIQAHEVAQWIPYMNQGTIATLWYGIQASFLQNVLLHAPWIAGSTDLLTVHHVGMFVDQIILLTGTWLLSRRFLSTPATFFVAVSIMGSCVWLDQPYWNFRLYYAVPLVLELGHRFLDTGRWRWFFLSANLLALQTIGNLPYFIPVVSFVVFAYFAWYSATNHRVVWERLASLRWGWPSALAIAFGVMSFVLAYMCVTVGTDQLVSYNPERNPDNTTTLDVFLYYGGFTDMYKWIDTVLRISPVLDNTLYAGILLAPLFLCGIFVMDRRRLHLLLVAVTLLLFTAATPLSTALFHVWPGMKYFRHIGLVSSLVKVLCCFVAGVGFEWLFRWGLSNRQRLAAGGWPLANSAAPSHASRQMPAAIGQPPARPRWAMRAGAVLSAMLLLASAWWALAISNSPPAIERYVSAITVAGTMRPLHVFDAGALAERLQFSAKVALAGAAIVFLVPVALSLQLTARARQVAFLVAAAFVTADLYQFKFAYLFDRSDVVQAEQLFVVRPSSMPFMARREPDLEHALAASSPRLTATVGFNRLLRRRFDGLGQSGAQYWTNNAFWFVDEVDNTFQVDSWLAPLDDFARMFREVAVPIFPVEHDAAARLGGLAADKIRFFAPAYDVRSHNYITPLLKDSSYKGNLLFLWPPASVRREVFSVPWSYQQSLSADDSRTLSHKVERFDANNLVVRVSNSEPAQTWMYYSDVWHPSWRATVNGRSVPVYQANVAYKAVPIERGENVIHFQFGSKLFSALAALSAGNAAFWLCAIAWMSFRILVLI